MKKKKWIYTGERGHNRTCRHIDDPARYWLGMDKEEPLPWLILSAVVGSLLGLSLFAIYLF